MKPASRSTPSWLGALSFSPRLRSGKEFFRAEIDRVESRPVAGTLADREIDLLTRKIEVVHGCRDIELNFGMRRGKPSETMNQPGFLARVAFSPASFRSSTGAMDLSTMP